MTIKTNDQSTNIDSIILVIPWILNSEVDLFLFVFIKGTLTVLKDHSKRVFILFWIHL